MNTPYLSYRPQHPPGCQCLVCWTADFCDHMHTRNDARQARSLDILRNPQNALAKPAEKQLALFAVNEARV